MGVNKYKLDKEQAVEVLSIDNSKAIQLQVGGAYWVDSVLCMLDFLEEEVAGSL